MKKFETEEEAFKFVSETVRKALEEAWAGKPNHRGEARFIVKHHLRLRYLYLKENDDITDSRGKVVARFGTANWATDNLIECTIQPLTGIKFVEVRIDLKDL